MSYYSRCRSREDNYGCSESKVFSRKKNIDPKDILVILFTNKAAGELRKKINKELYIDCMIATFHSTGNAILTNEGLVNNLILLFTSYFDASYEGSGLNEFFNKIA